MTPAGQAFLTEAQQLTEAMFNAAERCRSIADQQQKIRIEAPNHPRLLLEKVITRFTQQYPYIQPILKLHPGDNPFQRILTCQADVIELAWNHDEPPAPVGYTPLIDLPYMCLLAPTHPLAKQNVITLDALCGHTVAVNRFLWRSELLDALKTIPNIRFKEYPEAEEIAAVYNACYAQEIYITAAYYVRFLQPLIAIPLQLNLSHQLGVIHALNPSGQTKKFLATAQEFFQHYDYLKDREL